MEKDYYSEILDFSSKNNLENVQKVLPFVRECAYIYETNGLGAAYLNHALCVGWMLIDLRLPLAPEEMDLAISAALCHILPEIIENFDYETKLAALNVDPRVSKIVATITRKSTGTDDDMTAFYDRIKKDRLAYMVRLVDRANLVEQLYGTSTLEAKSYILETKRYFLPLCIWGKEHFPELEVPISIMMEKMRTLTQVTEILYSKYETEENSLNDEILALKEENSRLRGIVRGMKEE